MGLKLFKKPSAAASEQETTEPVVAKSALSTVVGDDALLTMKPEDMTSKQRRLLRRMLERQGGDEAPKKAEEEGERNVESGDKAPEGDEPPLKKEKKEGVDLNSMNEKAKAKLIRQLKLQGGKGDPNQTPKKAKKDFADLPEEERKRRLSQREAQQLAKEKREKGEDVSDGKHKHPLNSERRRSLKRKPSDMQKIVLKKKAHAESMNNKDKKAWNGGGFDIRNKKKEEAAGGGRGGGGRGGGRGGY